MKNNCFKFDLENLSPSERYHLLIQSIVPRPIAWVMTDNGTIGDNQYNFAPFSFFNAVSGTPPIIVLGFTVKSDGAEKDTLVNLKRNKRCTIHIASQGDEQKVSATSIENPFGQSELTDEMKVNLIQEYDGFPPRYAGCEITLFAELDHIHSWEKSVSTLAICEIKHIVVNSTVAEQANGRFQINQESLKALARLGGNSYTCVNKVFSAKRPK